VCSAQLQTFYTTFVVCVIDFTNSEMRGSTLTSGAGFCDTRNPTGRTSFAASDKKGTLVKVGKDVWDFINGINEAVILSMQEYGIIILRKTFLKRVALQFIIADSN